MYQCSTVQKSEDQRSRHAKKPKYMGGFFHIESVMIKDFQSEKNSHMRAFSCIGSLLIIVLFAQRYTGT